MPLKNISVGFLVGEKLKDEVADAQIFLYLIAGKYGLNIEELVREKQKINRERFGWK